MTGWSAAQATMFYWEMAAMIRFMVRRAMTC